MIPAPSTPTQMRLVRDEPDAPSDPTADQLRGERDAARAEADGLRRRAARLDDHLARVDAELRLAGRLQRDFLPKVLPRVGPARFNALFRPAGHVSGDFYDVFRLDEHHVGFYVADAVGHGVPAALLSMFIRHTLATKQIGLGGGYRLIPPGETLARLNAALLGENLSAATFATAAYGVVDVRTRQVTLARGGHPHPLVLGRAGTVTPVECDGGLLGVLPDEAYAEASFTLAPGDRLLLYTDGVEFAFAATAVTSLDRWQTLVAAHAAGSADALLAAVSDAADTFNPDGPPGDDLTLLTLELD